MIILKKGLTSKKANLADIIFIPIIVIGLFIIYLIGYPILNSITTELNESEMVDTQGMAIMTESRDRYIPVFDSIFLMIYAGLQLSLIISAIWIRTHPAYFVVALILMTIFTFVTFILSDFADEIGMSIDTEFEGVYDQFPIMQFMIRQLPIFEIVFGFVALIILYSKGEYG